MIAGAAALACIVVVAFLLFPRKAAPAGGGETFDADYFRQETPNDAEHAWFTFENEVWQQTSESTIYQRYNFVMREQNGVGFTITRVEAVMDGATGVIKMLLDDSGLRANMIDPNVPPFGTVTIHGGFPLGSVKSAGMAVFGNDATGKPMTFYTLIEF